MAAWDMRNSRCERRADRWWTEISSSRRKCYCCCCFYYILLLERENESQKRQTYDKEEDEDTGDRIGCSSGRARRIRRLVDKKESKKKRNDEEDWTSLRRSAGRSNGERGGSCYSWTANSMRIGKSAMSSFGGMILATICRN